MGNLTRIYSQADWTILPPPSCEIDDLSQGTIKRSAFGKYYRIANNIFPLTAQLANTFYPQYFLARHPMSPLSVFSLNEVYNSCLRCWFYSWSILTLRRASISVVQYLISKHCKNCTNGLYCRNCPYGKFLSLNGLATLKGLVKLGLLYWPQLCILGSKYPTNFITHVVWIG